MKSNIVFFIALMLLFIPACTWQPVAPPLAQPTKQPTENIKTYFPLSQGAYWVYQGTVKWTEETEVFEESLTWKMEVVEVIERGHVVGYVLKGHPADLIWYEKGKERGNHVIIQVGTGRYYASDQASLERLKDEEDFLLGLVHESQLILDIPLIPGKFFGEVEQLTRPDASYSWFVGQEQPVKLEGIKGVSPSREVPQYTLNFRTRPDHQIIEFVPGIGITRFVYVHHGTVSEVDVRLIEYQPGQSSAPTQNESS